jgi:excisionase family DNA binding protein
MENLKHTSFTQLDFEPLVSAVGAARCLGVHPNTLLLWARRGKIPAIRLGRRVTFRMSTLNAWLQQQYTVEAVRAA